MPISYGIFLSFDRSQQHWTKFVLVLPQSPNTSFSSYSNFGGMPCSPALEEKGQAFSLIQWPKEPTEAAWQARKKQERGQALGLQLRGAEERPHPWVLWPLSLKISIFQQWSGKEMTMMCLGNRKFTGAGVQPLWWLERRDQMGELKGDPKTLKSLECLVEAFELNQSHYRETLKDLVREWHDEIGFWKDSGCCVPHFNQNGLRGNKERRNKTG